MFDKETNCWGDGSVKHEDLSSDLCTHIKSKTHGEVSTCISPGLKRAPRLCQLEINSAGR